MLATVIVPTKNSAEFLPACLQSIANQTYTNWELIVVDNSSTDDTQAIAKKFTDKVYTKGPERSPQRNFGVSIAEGDIVLIIDSDMELENNVISQCIEQFDKHPQLIGLVIPEESFGTGFWAKCKRLERSFYVGIPWMEAARAFRKTAYLQLGGYNEKLISGEDWDLSQRIEATGPIGRVDAFIKHNEGHLKLSRTLQKKYYYARQFAEYSGQSTASTNVASQTSVSKRYALYFSKPGQLLKHPFISVGMLFMKTAEFLFGGVGLVTKKVAKTV